MTNTELKWTYEIYDNTTHTLLKTDTGFISEEDAELQARMDAKAENIKNFYIRTINE